MAIWREPHIRPDDWIRFRLWPGGGAAADFGTPSRGGTLTGGPHGEARPSFLSRRMEIYDLVTKPLVIRLSVYLQWMASWSGLGFNALIILLVIAADPFDLIDSYGLLAAIILTVQFVVILAATYIGLVTGWTYLLRHRETVRIFRVPISAAAVLTATGSSRLHLSLVYDVDLDFREMMADVPLTFLLAQIIEALFYTYVAPRLPAPAETVADAPPEPPAPPDKAEDDSRAATLSVAGRRLPIHALRHVSSHGHYLKCQVGNEEIWLRGRLLDVLNQTRSADGFQPHRSWWVSAGAVRDIRRGESGDLLVLTDGVEIPIPRARREEVRDWVARHARD